MAGIVIVGCPLLLGMVAGPCIDLPLLARGTATLAEIGMVHGWTALGTAVMIGLLTIYQRYFSPPASAETALSCAACVSLAALLTGYTISIAFTAIIG